MRTPLKETLTIIIRRSFSSSTECNQFRRLFIKNGIPNSILQLAILHRETKKYTIILFSQRNKGTTVSLRKGTRFILLILQDQTFVSLTGRPRVLASFIEITLYSKPKSKSVKTFQESGLLTLIQRLGREVRRV